MVWVGALGLLPHTPLARPMASLRTALVRCQRRRSALTLTLTPHQVPEAQVFPSADGTVVIAYRSTYVLSTVVYLVSSS